MITKFQAIIVALALHASGIVAGEFANSGTVHCGGLTCRPISGIFSRNPLTGGYMHVVTLPAGASNISITEMKNSNNLLVLQSMDQKFILNGDYTASPSAIYEAAGAIFDYRRIDGLKQPDGELLEGITEWITCTGPITEALNLMVFGHNENPGIKYDYLLPISSNYDSEEDIIEEDMETDSDNGTYINLKSSGYDSENSPIRPTEKRRRKFNWKVIGFSPCSKSCGGGTQTPIIRCTKDSPTRYYSARRCSHSEKPVINDNLLRCNTQPCPAYWRVEDWGDCRCNEGEGYREREIRCVQELAAGIVIQVNNAGCMEEKPSVLRRCDCPRINRRRTNYQRRVHAHARAQEPSVISNITQRRVASYKSEKAGVWLVSDWNEHCLAECGTGMEYRSIFCDRSSPNVERCDLRYTPDTTKPCKNEKRCDSGEWFTGEWGQCGGNCFNLTKSRQVICIRNQLIVEDYECMIEKPIRIQNCSFEEVEYCKPRWHYSSWTECSKTCGGGTQRRTVKCLDLDLKENTLKPSQMCRYSDREPIYRSCNTQKCEEVLDQPADVIQNDIIPVCADEFLNCHLVIKARLCGYEYYQQNCCYSCKGNPHISN